MADTGKPDGTDDGTSLAMPSFSLRRRKKAPQEPAATAPRTTSDPRPDLEPDPAGRAFEQPVLRPGRQLPRIALSGLPAAAVTGVLVGGLAVLLTWLATSSCDVVRGTSACGGGPGLLILAGVLVLLAYAGGLLLRLFGAPDAGSTSILAVGILTVLVLVFLLGSIDEWWMVIALPVVALLAYCASWWVTTSVMGDDDAGNPLEVR